MPSIPSSAVSTAIQTKLNDPNYTDPAPLAAADLAKLSPQASKALKRALHQVERDVAGNADEYQTTVDVPGQGPLDFVYASGTGEIGNEWKAFDPVTGNKLAEWNDIGE